MRWKKHSNEIQEEKRKHSKKVIFRTMRTMRKQFPVTQLTSGEVVDFRKTRFHPPKKWRPKWSNVTLIWLNCPASATNFITKANGNNFYTIGSFKINGKIQLKPPRENVSVGSESG